MEDKKKNLDMQLFDAAKEGKLAACQKLIREGGANVNAINPGWFSFTALHEAAQNGRIATCRALLTAGALVDPKCSKKKETPLRMAVAGDHAEIVKLLIKHGADVNAKNEHGTAPLYDAGNGETVRILLAAGAELSWRCDDGYTALHGAAVHNFPDVCRALIEAGADVRDDNHGKNLTPFQRAVCTGMLDSAQYFLSECGETVNQMDYTGSSLLDLATSEAMRDLLLAVRAEQTIEGALGERCSSSSSKVRTSPAPL